MQEIEHATLTYMKTSNLHLKTNPTLADIQQYVKNLEIERGFIDQTVTQNCILLVEEIGELCKVIRKFHAGMSTDINKQYEFDAAGEIADIIIMLSAIANRMNVDMEQALRQKEEINKQRTWQ